MKKFLLISFLLTICANAFGQSITFRDIVFLTHQQSGKTFLTTKSFTLLEQKNDYERYALNEHTDKEERVFYSHKSILYNSLDKNYIRSLISQIQKQYTLIIKDDNTDYTFYQFGDPSINIMVNINKGPKVFSSVSMSKRP